MNRQEKSLVINNLEHQFSTNDAAFIVGFQGMNVKQLECFRKEVRKEHASFIIAKARLGKRAFVSIKQNALAEGFFKQQVGFVFGSGDTSSLTKFMYTFAQKNKAFKVVGCLVQEHVYDEQAFVRLALLPSKNVLLAQLCGVLKAPMKNCVGVLNMVTLRLLLVLQQVAKNK